MGRSVARGALQPLVDLSGVLPATALQALAQNVWRHLQADGQQRPGITRLRLWKMRARTVHDHIKSRV